MHNTIVDSPSMDTKVQLPHLGESEGCDCTRAITSPVHSGVMQQDRVTILGEG